MRICWWRSLFALGLMAKPMLVTLPPLLLLLDFWPLARIRFGQRCCLAGRSQSSGRACCDWCWKNYL